MNKFFKRTRRGLMGLALLVTLLSIVLLMNFTHPNPTGRRYSSEIPVTTGQGSGSEIGLSGERILAHDLRLPRNDEAAQRLCLCQESFSPPRADCRTCFAEVPIQSTHRRPDFIGDGFLAESKNRIQLSYDDDLVAQLSDYARAAEALDRPLWLYVRVNTVVDPRFVTMIEETGGGVIHYFAVPGYVDPVDLLAMAGLIGSGVTVFMALGWEFSERRRQPPTPKAPHRNDPTSRAERRTRDMEDFARRTDERARRDLDDKDL